MKLLNAKILISIATLVCGTFSYAGGCHFEDVSPSKVLASRYMAALLKDKVNKIDEAMKAKGEELTMVFVARRGESLDKLHPYKDDPSVPLEQYLNELDAKIRAIKKSGNGQNASANIDKELKELMTGETLKYSHMGILLRRNHSKNIPDDKQPESNFYYITHLLAECNQTSMKYGASDIFFEQLERFFWDTKVLSTDQSLNQALIIVPSPAIQKAYAKLLDYPEIFRDGIHEKHYNVASVPFRFKNANDPKAYQPQDYHQASNQNSNQWPVEMLAASEVPFGQIRSRYDAQTQLMATNFRPTIAEPSGLKNTMACALRVGKIGPIKLWDASALITCDDQVYREDGIIELITVNSVVYYMIRNQLISESIDKPGDPAIYEISADPKVISDLDEKGKALEREQKKLADALKAAEQANSGKH